MNLINNISTLQLPNVEGVYKMLLDLDTITFTGNLPFLLPIKLLPNVGGVYIFEKLDISRFLAIKRKIFIYKF